MKMKDLEQLRRWLAGNATLEEVENTSTFGLVGNERFTENARRAYMLLWTWGAPRFSGVADTKQDRFFNRCGYPALMRRFERSKAIAAKIAAGTFPVRWEP
jgi:hypothetical protein